MQHDAFIDLLSCYNNFGFAMSLAVDPNTRMVHVSVRAATIQ